MPQGNWSNNLIPYTSLEAHWGFNPGLLLTELLGNLKESAGHEHFGDFTDINQYGIYGFGKEHNSNRIKLLTLVWLMLGLS